MPGFDHLMPTIKNNIRGYSGLIDVCDSSGPSSRAQDCISSVLGTTILWNSRPHESNWHTFKMSWAQGCIKLRKRGHVGISPPINHSDLHFKMCRQANKPIRCLTWAVTRQDPMPSCRWAGGRAAWPPHAAHPHPFQQQRPARHQARWKEAQFHHLGRQRGFRNVSLDTGVEVSKITPHNAYFLASAHQEDQSAAHWDHKSYNNTPWAWDITLTAFVE